MLWQGQRAKRQTIGIVSVFVGHVAHAHPLTQQVLANNGEVRISKLTFFISLPLEIITIIIIIIIF